MSDQTFFMSDSIFGSSGERRGFGLGNRSPKSQIASDFPSHPEIAMQHCFLLSRKSLQFLGSAMGIAKIAAISVR